MQGVHWRGSEVVSECCKVGYLATLARGHVHKFICSGNRGLPSLGTYAESSFERMIGNA